MMKKFSLQNEPGIWDLVHKHAIACLNDAKHHINDLPLGRYALIHVSSREETINPNPLSAVRWSLVMNDTSPLMLTFPTRFIKAYQDMDITQYVAVFIHIIGSGKAQLWNGVIFKRHEG